MGFARRGGRGAVDEANSAIEHRPPAYRTSIADLGDADARIQNDMFDLGADLATPERDKPLGWEPLRIVAAQVTRLEGEIDAMNAAIPPLDSFVLPGGSPLSAHLHLAAPNNGAPGRATDRPAGDAS